MHGRAVAAADQSDPARQERQRLLAVVGEQALCRQQLAKAGELSEELSKTDRTNLLRTQ